MVAVVLPAQEGYSQSKVGLQYWFDYNVTRGLNPGWDVYGDFGVRFLDGEKGYRRFVFRPSARYHITDQIWASGGVALFQERINPELRDSELRFFQGINARWPYKKVKVNHYLRMEQRFQFATFTESTQFQFRIRYAISGNINIMKNKWSSYPYIHLAAEIFSTPRTLTEVLGDELRLVPGVGYRISARSNVQLHAMIVRFRVLDVFETDQVIFRLRWFHLL